MKALIFYGGWEGHTPKESSEIIHKALEEDGFQVERHDHQECLDDAEALKALDLIVPVWTMGKLEGDRSKNLLEAVKSGVGFGGFHGGAGDAFRGNVSYEWMVGGLFLGHPHVGDYQVRLTDEKHVITDGMAKTFPYNSEQYYMAVDPGVTVLADTIYQHEGKQIVMPVVWVKQWGAGRVFYSALGHVAQEFLDYPEVLKMTVRGMRWAAEGKPKA